MKYYLDISLLPDAEANLGFLWYKVYQQIHIALVDNKIAENQSAVAISFPKYGDKGFPLGDKLRLLADQQTQLEQLDVNKWLKRLADHTDYTSVKAVPLSIDTFVTVKRKQFDTNLERLARRRARRKGGTFEEALIYLQGFKNRETTLPFIHVKSLSGDSQFRLFIEQKLVKSSTKGKFNCYGLSKTATVPWF